MHPSNLPLQPAGDDNMPPIPDRDIYTPPAGPPQTDRIPPAVYEAMGADNIYAFSEAFYKRLGASTIAHLFPTTPGGLKLASQKSGAMFIFLFGGPHEYQRRFGPPRLRMRHLPFVIDENARQEWLRCLRETLAEAPRLFSMPAEHVPAIDTFMTDFSAWMVNAKPKQPDQDNTK
ncbi:MAG: hypothetical protein AAF356_11535 [Planctomycetota bacterium]